MSSRVYEGSEVVAGGGRGEYGRGRRTKWMVLSSGSSSEIYFCAGKNPSVIRFVLEIELEVLGGTKLK